MESDIKPGEYHGNNATLIIRKMQLSVVKLFEKYVSLFDRLELHKRVLNYYTIQQHGVIINLKRYTSFKDLDEEVLSEFEKKTRTIREDYRRNLETAKYLLETNLVINHVENTDVCSNEDFEFLLAFANWLVVLQENSDTCHHTDLDVYITVDSEYRVDTNFNKDSEEKYDTMLVRKYNTLDYHIKNDEIDTEFFKKAMGEFYNDTKIDFQLLILLFDYMQLAVVNEDFAEEIYPNVISVDKTKFLCSFNDYLKEKVDNFEVLGRLLDFITLKTHLLKTTECTQHDILPIWEREKRENRFEIKPIIENADKLIFSPVSLNYLKTLWISGMTEWYLPYETGLNNLTKILKNGKRDMRMKWSKILHSYLAI